MCLVILLPTLESGLRVFYDETTTFAAFLQRKQTTQVVSGFGDGDLHLI